MNWLFSLSALISIMLVRFAESEISSMSWSPMPVVSARLNRPSVASNCWNSPEKFRTISGRSCCWNASRPDWLR
ncbi:hypothetical protein CLAFUW4_20035 [Fulvia fulva]|nr:hypothetical protein CLAFUR4_20035 [Fulvia fulva]KAK4628528.1 hypothetical protein CLAFUR0_20035 [Fulvia fulva]WPV13996.1 hypothetical protein CLAFUW4_20035 [Fulvia fulva]